MSKREIDPPGEISVDARKDRKPGKSGPGMGAILGGVYVVGLVVTTSYYVISGFTGCEARTLSGRCIDFGLMIEAGFYALIWPLHWLLEIIEAIAG